MFSSTITTLALLAVASVNGSPTPVDKRDPQFSVNLPNLIPVSGNFGGFNITRGPNGNSVVSFGRNRFPFGFFGGGFGGNTGTTTNTTNGRRPGRFPFFFKREGEGEVEKREPQFDFDFPNELPVLGDLPFGINIGQLANGNSVAHFGNATTGTQGFPFNFLNFKREGEHQLQVREPQFQFNFTNRLPVTGRFPFGLTIGQGANGNSIAFFGNATTGSRPFPFNFLPFNLKREQELAVRGEAKRAPQFDFDFSNELPVLGDLPFGINIGQLANGNSVAHFGNATTGTQSFPFNFLNFKRDGEIAARAEEKRAPQFDFDFSNELPVIGDLPFGINIGQLANGNSVAHFGNATTGTSSFPFNFLNFKRGD